MTTVREAYWGKARCQVNRYETNSHYMWERLKTVGSVGSWYGMGCRITIRHNVALQGHNMLSSTFISIQKNVSWLLNSTTLHWRHVALQLNVLNLCADAQRQHVGATQASDRQMCASHLTVPKLQPVYWTGLTVTYCGKHWALQNSWYLWSSAM